MHNNPQRKSIDCRGQRCPAPILATAKAARLLGDGGGLLEVLADDDAFPLDVRSWCRSAGADLMELEETSAGHRAVVRVREAAPSVGPPASSSAASAKEGPRVGARLDCRGMRCPQPILEIARAARSLATGDEMVVVADDDAFSLDVTSWCRSSGATLLSLTEDKGAYVAQLRVAPRSKPPEAPRSLARVGMRQTVPAPPNLPRSSTPLARLSSRRNTSAVMAAARELARKQAAQARTMPDRVVQEGPVSEEDPVVRVLRSVSVAPDAIAEVPAGRSAEIDEPASNAKPQLRIDVGFFEPDERLEELQITLLAAEPLPDVVTIHAPDTSFTAELLTWCTSCGHQLVSLNGAAPVVAEVAINRASLVAFPATERAVAMDPPPASHPTSAAPLSVGEASLVTLPPSPRLPLIQHMPPLPSPAVSDEAGVAEMALTLAPPRKRCSLLVLHNDKEALLAALLVANGAAAQGMDVSMFFTFWGLNLLRGEVPNETQPREHVAWPQRLFKWLMPRGPEQQKLGKLNFGGMGGGMMNALMRDKQIMDLPELMRAAQEQDVRFVACTMSMEVMGITKRDLHPYETLEYGGVTTFVESSANAQMSLVF